MVLDLSVNSPLRTLTFKPINDKIGPKFEDSFLKLG